MARKKKAPPLTPSKRAKGFPIRLSNTHLLVIEQTYAWLKTQGLWDEQTEEAMGVLPRFSEPVQQAMGSVDKVIKDGLRCMEWRPSTGKGHRDPLHTIAKTQTVRIRAEHITCVSRLFRLLAPFITTSQTGSTLLKRADKLEEISVLDRLYDAQRDSDENATLSLRD